MYLTVRTYRGIAGPLGEVGRRVADGLIPVLGSLAGFRAYYAAAIDNGSDAFAVSLFDTREQGLAANERTRAWVAANLRDLLPNPPEVSGGEVLHEAAAPRAGSEGDRHLAVVAAFDAIGPVERALLAAQEAIAGLPPGAGGLPPDVLRFWAFRSESHTNRGIAVLILGGGGVVEARERILDPVAERIEGMLASPPDIEGGEVLVATATGA